MAKKAPLKTKPLPSLSVITKAIEKYEAKLRTAPIDKAQKATVRSVLQLLSETKKALRARCRPADKKMGGHSPRLP